MALPWRFKCGNFWGGELEGLGLSIGGEACTFVYGNVYENLTWGILGVASWRALGRV